MLVFITSVTFLVAPVLSITIPSNTNNPSPLDRNDEPLDIENHPNLELLPTAKCGAMNNDKLLSGNKSLLYEMPWMVLLSYFDTVKGNKLSCVGTLINERYVLTAAQCVTFLGNRSLNGVILGELDVRTDPDCDDDDWNPICNDKVINATIEEVIPHPGFGVIKGSFSDDIALIRLAERVDFIKTYESVGAVCLPVTAELQHETLEGLYNTEIAGWEIREDKIQSPVLVHFPVSTISNEECQGAYNRTISVSTSRITSRHLCAKNRYSYGGDPGGPLILPGSLGWSKQVQRAIVSFGPRLRGSDLPNVYTRVAFYMKWILDNIRS